MCFSEAPDNRVAFPKPEGIQPPIATPLFARLLKARVAAEGPNLILNSVIKVDRIPNGKADVNNNGPFSTDYIGGSWDYPNASYARKAEIFNETRKYQEGFLYFLSNDPSGPEALHREMNQWGLCKDEFTDNRNWPNQLYIRESRRMVGDYVMVQKDLQTELTKPDPIGMGSYNSDSHNVERIVGPDGFVRNEGDMQVAVKPYQIPYRIMLPKPGEATNLPGAGRLLCQPRGLFIGPCMEPQYMILGQAAGVAAKLAITNATSIQTISVAALIKRLKEQGAIMEYIPSGQTPAIEILQKSRH